MQKAIVIGLMSGTSLDGLDLAACSFDLDDLPNYQVLAAETIDYSEFWRKRLSACMQLEARELTQLDAELGLYFGECIKTFIQKNKINADLIASHGHTVFHQPEQGYTLQIGSGASIYSICKIKTVCDFRSLDVALGGQGAPLVPIGDALLFGHYDQCLNLGGIANLSAKQNGKTIAFDICAFNMVFNQLSQQLHYEYDSAGKLASEGKLNKALLEQLQQLKYYQLPAPKSLGREDIERDLFSLLQKCSLPVLDQLRTCSEHFAEQIAKTINELPGEKILVSGGGAYNDFFLDRLLSKTHKKILIPDQRTINFKEAIVFALLGFLRINNRVNTLAEVTGASRDSCGGSIFG